MSELLSSASASAAAFGVLAALTALSGLIALSFAAGFTRRNAGLFAAFAAGLIVGIAILRLIPEAMHAGDAAPWMILSGFAAGFLIQRAMEAGFGRGSALALALAPVFAIALHSVLDGVVYAVAFEVDAALAVTAGLGLVLHEFPEAVICFLLLQRAGASARWAFVGAFVAAGLTTFVGALGAVPVTSSLTEATLGLVFAFVAGLLLNVGSGHLLSHAGDAGWGRATPAVIAGGATAAVLAAVQPAHSHFPAHGDHAHEHTHGHDHEHEHPDEHAHDHPHDPSNHRRFD